MSDHIKCFNFVEERQKSEDSNLENDWKNFHSIESLEVTCTRPQNQAPNRHKLQSEFDSERHIIVNKPFEVESEAVEHQIN